MEMYLFSVDDESGLLLRFVAGVFVSSYYFLLLILTSYWIVLSFHSLIQTGVSIRSSRMNH
jgi:hypothetical protein